MVKVLRRVYAASAKLFKTETLRGMAKNVLAC